MNIHLCKFIIRRIQYPKIAVLSKLTYKFHSTLMWGCQRLGIDKIVKTEGEGKGKGERNSRIKSEEKKDLALPDLRLIVGAWPLRFLVLT